MRFHFGKELMKSGEVEVTGVTSQDMAADGLTKIVPKRRIAQVQE